MNRLVFVLTTGIAVLTIAVSRDSIADNPGSWDGEGSKTKDIDQLIEGYMEQHGVPGMSIAIAENHQLTYAKGYGLADVEHSVPATEDTRYRTASIAKPITSALVLSLADDGKLDLDVPVQSYVKEYPTKRWPLSCRQLLGHLPRARRVQRV